MKTAEVVNYRSAQVPAFSQFRTAPPTPTATFGSVGRRPGAGRSDETAQVLDGRERLIHLRSVGHHGGIADLVPVSAR